MSLEFQIHRLKDNRTKNNKKYKKKKTTKVIMMLLILIIFHIDNSNKWSK